MNAAQIHLALNHAPLFLSAIGGVILIIGMIRKNESFKILSFSLLVAAAIFTAPVFLTGEGTEELIENLPGVNKTAIESHEDMAKISLIIIIISGIISLAGIFLRKKAGFSKIVSGIALLFSLASFGTMAQTAHLGGLIRHSELQAGAVNGTNKNEVEELEEQKNKAQREEEATKDSLKQIEKSQKNKNDDD